MKERLNTPLFIRPLAENACSQIQRGLSRDIDVQTRVWTASLGAWISFPQGLTSRLVSGARVYRVFKRLGNSWKRATHEPTPDQWKKLPLSA